VGWGSGSIGNVIDHTLEIEPVVGAKLVFLAINRGGDSKFDANVRLPTILFAMVDKNI